MEKKAKPVIREVPIKKQAQPDYLECEFNGPYFDKPSEEIFEMSFNLLTGESTPWERKKVRKN